MIIDINCTLDVRNLLQKLPGKMHEEKYDINYDVPDSSNENDFELEIGARNILQNLNRNSSSYRQMIEETQLQKNEEGMFQCNQCQTQFTQQGSLKRIIKAVHECVKYACNQCNLKFTDKSPLSRHIRSKHEGVRYACNQCDYQATQHYDLTKHAESNHGFKKVSINN